MNNSVIDNNNENQQRNQPIDVLVSVIIVNYKTEKLLVDTIHSVFERSKDIRFEIIVVDNNSGDNSEQLIKEKFNGIVKYLALPENIGFGRANNAGAKLASGKYLFFLNSDTILISNALKILADFLENNPSVGICGGNLLTENSEPAHSSMPVLPSLFLEVSSILGHLPLKLIYGKRFDYNTSGKPKKVADIIGADLLIRAELFEDMEGFSPDFFLYNEESELSYRVQKKGFEVYSVPEAEIIHLESRSMDSEISKRRIGLVSRKIYYKKTQNKASRILIDGVFVIKCLMGLSISLLKRKKSFADYWQYALKNGMIEIW